MGMHCESQPWHGLEAGSIPTQDTLCQFVFQTGMLFSFTPCGPVELEWTFTLVLVGVHAYIWRRGMDARNASITSPISKLPSCCLCSVPESFEKLVLRKSARRVVHHLESIRSRPTTVGSGSARLSSCKAL